MPILIGSAAMAGAAITPPTTKAVEPSRSFFIILPLSLIRDWYVPKGLSDRRKWKPETRRHTDPANTATAIEHSGQTRVKKWTQGRTILPVPVASLSHFRPLIGAFPRIQHDNHGPSDGI